MRPRSVLDADLEAVRRAYEEHSRRAVEERLAFADRVQEVLDHAQHLQAVLDDCSAQAASLREEVAALRARIAALHEELVEARRHVEVLEHSRSFRYTAPLRRLGGAIRGR